MHSKGNYKQGEKTPSEWEKIRANETTGKGLISKIYKQAAQAAQYQKNKQSNQKVGKERKKKMGRRLKQSLLQRRHTDG